MELIIGECKGKIRSIPTPKLTRRTVNVAPDARPFFEITTPSNACKRSFSFSPSPSFNRTLTRTVSPGRNSGKSLRSCASCSFAMTRFMSVFPADPLGRGQHNKPKPQLYPICCDSARTLPCVDLLRPTLTCPDLRPADLYVRMSPNHLPAKPLHLFQLRTKLEQQQIHSRGFKRRHPLSHLLRGSHESRPQSAVRHRVILERYLLLQLRPRQPLLVIRIARRGLLHVGNPLHFLQRFALGFPHDGIARNAKFHRRQPAMSSPPRPQVVDFLPYPLRRIAVHQIRVALFRDQILGSLRFAARINARSRLRHRLRLEHVILDAIVFP